MSAIKLRQILQQIQPIDKNLVAQTQRRLD